MFRHQRVFRVAAAIFQRDVREHRIAWLKFCNLASDLFDNSGDVSSRNHWEYSLFVFGKHSRSDHSVDRIHAGRDHANKNLIVLWVRPRHILILQNLWATILMNDKSMHRWLGCSRRRRGCERDGEYILKNRH